MAVSAKSWGLPPASMSLDSPVMMGQDWTCRLQSIASEYQEPTCFDEEGIDSARAKCHSTAGI